MDEVIGQESSSFNFAEKPFAQDDRFF